MDDVDVSYAVYRDDELLQRLPGDTNTLSVAALAPWTEYRFAVFADDPAGNRSVVPAAALVTTPDDVAPTWGPDASLEVLALTPREVTLRWGAATPLQPRLIRVLAGLDLRQRSSQILLGLLHSNINLIYV